MSATATSSMAGALVAQEGSPRICLAAGSRLVTRCRSLNQAVQAAARSGQPAFRSSDAEWSEEAVPVAPSSPGREGLPGVAPNSHALGYSPGAALPASPKVARVCVSSRSPAPAGARFVLDAPAARDGCAQGGAAVGHCGMGPGFAAGRRHGRRCDRPELLHDLAARGAIRGRSTSCAGRVRRAAHARPGCEGSVPACLPCACPHNVCAAHLCCRIDSGSCGRERVVRTCCVCKRFKSEAATAGVCSRLCDG